MSSDNPELIIVKIKTLSEANNVIIDKIKSLETKKIIAGRHYAVKIEDYTVKIVESTTGQTGKQIASAFDANGRALNNTKEMNMFNDNVDYNVTSFDDIVRLNRVIPDIVDKYAWLDPARSPPLLRLFLQNMEVLQVFLGEIDSLLIDIPSSMDELNTKALCLTEQMAELLQCARDFSTISSPLPITPQTPGAIDGCFDASTIKGELTLESPYMIIKEIKGDASVSWSKSIQSGTWQWILSVHAYVGQPSTVDGWIFLGIRDSKNCSQWSFEDKKCFGMSVTNYGSKYKQGLYRNGGFDLDKQGEHVNAGDQLTLTIDCDAGQLSLNSTHWRAPKVLNFPTNCAWFPHINTYSTSVKVVSFSKIH